MLQSRLIGSSTIVSSVRIFLHRNDEISLISWQLSLILDVKP